MNRKTCRECERLRREFDEAVHKSFRLEERLRHAKIRHDNEQAKALAGRLAHLADERMRFYRLLIEHEAQGHPTARGGGV
jgi:Mn-dependent DtxR family transcriptional regulator